MKQIIADQVSIIPLGRQGEHLACQIVFDLRAWETLYGSGTAELLHQRPGDDMPYPVPLSWDGSWALWNVTDADTAQSGLGRCELRYRADDTLVKSRIWKTHIDGAMGEAAGEAPEPEQSWVNRVLEAGTAAEAAADRAEAAVVHGPVLSEGDTWMIWDSEQGTYADTGVYAGGQIPTIDPESKHWIVGGVDTGVSAVGEMEESEIINDNNDGREWTLLADAVLDEDAATIAITQTPDGEVFSVRELAIFGKCIGNGTDTAVTLAPYSTKVAYGHNCLVLGNVLSSTDGAESYFASEVRVLPEVIFSRTQYNKYNRGVGLEFKVNASNLRDEAYAPTIEIGNPITTFAIGVWQNGTAGVFRAGTKMKVYGR